MVRVGVGVVVRVGVGDAVRVGVGAAVGAAVGGAVGVGVGGAVGFAVGAAVGLAVGIGVGAAVGIGVGVAVAVATAGFTVAGVVAVAVLPVIDDARADGDPAPIRPPPAMGGVAVAAGVADRLEGGGAIAVVAHVPPMTRASRR